MHYQLYDIRLRQTYAYAYMGLKTSCRLPTDIRNTAHDNVYRHKHTVNTVCVNVCMKSYRSTITKDLVLFRPAGNIFSRRVKLKKKSYLVRMGGSQSLWAITGTIPGEETPESKPDANSVGIDDLVKLESFKIDDRQVLESSFKVHNSEGEMIFQALPLTSSSFSSYMYKEIFRVSDSRNDDAMRVFECLSTNLEDVDTSSLPGIFMGYVKIVKETLSKPEFHILNKKGEARLFVRPDALRVTSNDYKVYSDESRKIGNFGPRISAGIKGKIPRELEVGLKAGVLLSAVVVCGKSGKERKRTVILVASH